MKAKFCKRFIVLLSVLLNLIMTGRAQERYQPNKVIPPSPTASSLGVYGDIQVGYYTGTANVSIPLYTISTSKHNIPISLGYSSSGVKVSQDASWVGLGWSLNVGGLIGRTIRGLEDFSAYGYNTISSLPPNTEDNNHEIHYNTDTALANRNYFLDIINRSKDGEPDIFFYNFGGYSGKFVMGKQGDSNRIYTAEQNNLSITYDNLNIGQLGQWLVKTPDGYKYYFRTPEVAEDYYKNSEIPEASLKGLEPTFIRSYEENVSAWYLDSIVAPGGEVIRFHYEVGLSLSLIGVTQKRYDLIGIFYQHAEAQLYNNYNYHNASRQVIENVYLKRIEFNTGYVEFNRTSRVDIERYPTGSVLPEKLSEIVVYDLNDQIIKKLKLDYSYFNNNTVSQQYDYTYKRLKLDSVTELGSTTISKPPYIFEYQEPNGLPSKYSKQIDEWGFYSMFYTPVLPSELLPTLLPKVKKQLRYGSHTYVVPDSVFNGTDRTPDQSGTYNKRGILTKVQYPTGGTTEFSYELNEYKLAQADTVIPYGTLAEVKTQDLQVDQLVDSFSISGSLNVTFFMNFYSIVEDDTLSNSIIIGYLKDADDNSIIDSFTRTDHLFTKNYGTGNYYLEAVVTLDYHNHIRATYTGNPIIITNAKAGGIRVKSISNYDYTGIKVGYKQFLYTTNGLSNGPSSGRMLYRPLNHYNTRVRLSLAEIVVSIGEYLVRSSYSLNPIGFYSAASPVCYDQVHVWDGVNGEGGRTVYNYYNGYVTFLPENQEEMPPLLSGKNGKLISQDMYSLNGIKLKTITYDYELKDEQVLKGVKILRPSPQNGQTFIYEEGDVKYYDNASQWWVVSSVTESSFINSSTVTSTKSIYYENATHKNVTKEEMIDTDGFLNTKRYKYPIDFSAQSPYNSMVTDNIIAPVILETGSRGSQVLDSVKTNFNNWGGFFAPITIESKRIGSPWKTRLRFHEYDSIGNLLSVSKENDVRMSYVYGYLKAYPFIEAKNITTSDLNAKVGLALNDIGYSGGFNDLDNFLNSLGDMTTSTQKNLHKSFCNQLNQRIASSLITYSIYTYKPLVGVTSETNTNNRSVYYEYDTLGRLTIAKDDEGNMINKYKYNYKQ